MAQPRPVPQFLNIIGRREKGQFVTAIEPFRELRLERFTVVVWQNQSETPVRIRIGSGKECREASQTTLLYLGAEFLMARCYVTQKPIAAGGVLQTEFEEAGRFQYEIEYVGEKVRETGVITVY